MVSAGGGEREDLFRRTGEPYVWQAGSRRASGSIIP